MNYYSIEKRAIILQKRACYNIPQINDNVMM